MCCGDFILLVLIGALDQISKNTSVMLALVHITQLKITNVIKQLL